MGSVSKLNLEVPTKRSRISQLPDHVREGLDQRCLDPNLSLTDIEIWLSSEGYRISTSTIHRHQQKIFKTELIAPIEEKQAKLVKEIPPSEASEITLKRALSRLSQELEVAESGREIAMIARAIAEISRTLRLFEKDRLEAERDKPQEKKPQGLSEDRAAQIRHQILGIID